jgi:hypothetical protein
MTNLLRFCRSNGGFHGGDKRAQRSLVYPMKIIEALWDFFE